MIQETLTAPPLAATPAASPLPGPRGGLKLGPGADRLAAYEEAARVHGGVVCVSEEPPLFLVSHPDHVKHVLQDNQANYRQNVRKKVLMGRQSLALSAGDEWRKRRRLLQPLFNQQRLAPLAPGIVTGTQRMVDRWRGPAERGEAIDVARDVAALTLDLLSEALLGSAADRGGLRRSVSTAFEYFNNRARAVRQRPLWVPTPNNLGLILALRRLSAAVRGTVARRRESGEPGDLLSAMLAARDDQSGQAMSPDQIQDEIMMLLVMGHMTTAVAATWTFFLLARHPEAEARVRAEIAAVVGDRPAEFADVQRLAYTRKVIEETMRLYPPSWTFSRRAVADDEIGGCRIPAGAVLTIAPWVTHRRPELWPDPERFDPERFDAQRAADRPRFAYYPFGGGLRVCIARDMAMMELPLILATVLQRYTLRPVPGVSAAPVAGIVLRPRSGLRMTLHDPAAPPRRSEVAQRPFSTLPELLLAPPVGDAPACQLKVDGRYIPVPRADLLNRARRLARGLAALGVAPGERLALLAANGPEWVAADLGALAAGAVVVPLQVDLDTGEAVRLLRESGARYVLADAGRLADLLGRRGELSDIRAWVQLGGAPPVAEGVLGLSSLLERGDGAQAPALETLVRQRRPEEPASLIYTPGTTGAPKAVELTHGNLAAAVLGLAETVAIRPGDVVFSYLPLTRPAERSLLYLCLHRGATLAWAGSEATAGADARLVQPHVLSTTPDFWKHLLNWLFQTVQASSPRRRRAFQLAVSMGRAALPFRIQHRRPSLILGGGFWLGVADRLVFSRVRERLGGRFRFALSGVDRIPHGWITFLWAAGIPVYETYSLAEATGIVALNTPRAIQPGTVGIPLPGVEIRISEDGEILVRGDVVAGGGQPVPQVDAEGWLHTGDGGAIDEAAMLTVQGRQGDFFTRPGGRQVSPGALETLLRSSHFVSHVFVTGEGRPYNVALIAPDVGALPRMIQRFNIAGTDVAAVMRDPRVREHFDQDIQGFNDKLPAHEKIQAWHLLSNEFSVVGGELTAAGTLRRRAILEKYAAEIDRLYAGPAAAMKGAVP